MRRMRPAGLMIRQRGTMEMEKKTKVMSEDTFSQQGFWQGTNLMISMRPNGP